MELAEKRVAGTHPAYKSSRGKQVHRIPDAVVAENAEDRCWYSHRKPTCDPALDAVVIRKVSTGMIFRELGPAGNLAASVRVLEIFTSSVLTSTAS